MLVNAVIYTFAADSVDTVIPMLRDIAVASRQEPGCLGFEVNRSNDDPNAFVLYERWVDAAALEAHYATEHFIALGVNGIRPLALSRIAHRCTPLSA
jgi:quinol monooxygenase YgiN